MATSKKDRLRQKRRELRVRSKMRFRVKAKQEYRVSLFRSLKHIYAQLHNDATHQTVVSCSSQVLEKASGDKVAIARAVGVELAKRALAKGVESARFDRGRYLYHGRAQALAEGIREGGLKV